MVLVNKEFELLLFLAENPNLVFSKDTLFDRVWGMDSLGDAATVTVHINRLRDKLGKDESKNQCIETVWGAGYRFRIDLGQTKRRDCSDEKEMFVFVSSNTVTHAFRLRAKRTGFPLG